MTGLRRLAAWAVLAAIVAAGAATFGVARVGGGSMEPALASGDVLVYRRGSSGVTERDVVLVSKAGWPEGVIHRVVAVTPDGAVVTRGDANPIADRDPVPLRAVVGRTVAAVPFGRVARALARLGRGATLGHQTHTFTR